MNGDDNDTDDNLDGEKSLFCSEIYAEEHKTSDRANVTGSVTCERRVAQASENEWLAASHVTLMHAQAHSITLRSSLRFFPTQFRVKERLITAQRQLMC